jgi:sulfur relay (sulfurtransferase) complex TusBCD TusD component (DsrE family)
MEESQMKIGIISADEGFRKGRRKIFACGTCLKLRNSGPTDVCSLAGLKDMHAIIKESDRVITF